MEFQDMVLRGFVNPGTNCCSSNAVLQCLFHNPMFSNWLLAFGNEHCWTCPHVCTFPFCIWLLLFCACLILIFDFFCAESIVVLMIAEFKLWAAKLCAPDFCCAIVFGTRFDDEPETVSGVVTHLFGWFCFFGTWEWMVKLFVVSTWSSTEIDGVVFAACMFDGRLYFQ